MATQNTASDRADKIAQTRAELGATLEHYFTAYAARIAEREQRAEEYKQAEAAYKQRKRSAEISGVPFAEPKPTRVQVPSQPVLAVEAEVGLGKSYAVGTRIAQMAVGYGLPIAILAPTRQLCHEYAENIKQAASRDKWRVYRGREDYIATTQDGQAIPTTPWTCYAKTAADAAGERGHRPAHSLCTNCQHGQAHAVMRGKPEAREKAIKWFKQHQYAPDEISAIPTCRFLYEGLPDQLAAQVLVSPVQAFSEAIGMWLDRDDPDRPPVQRLIFVDEASTIAKKLTIGIDDVNGWRKNVEKRLTWLQRLNDEHDADEIETLKVVQQITTDLIAAMNSDRAPDAALAKAIVTTDQRLRNLKMMMAGTARFEGIEYDKTANSHEIPLRGFHALALACASAAVKTDEHAYIVQEIAPVIEWAFTKGSVVFMDATIDPILRLVIERLGGSVHRARVEQNIEVERVIGFMYARGKTNSQHYSYTAKAAIRDIKEIASDMPKPCAVISHRAYFQHGGEAGDAKNAAQATCEAIENEFSGDVLAGWFGKHDRGHNDWKQRHIAMVGMPIQSPASLRDAWSERQALARLAKLDLPDWTMDGDGSSDAMSKLLPADPVQRQWLCDIYAATTVQVIGRARALHSDDTITIRLYGGIVHKDLDAALARYGVFITKVSHNTIHDAQPGRKPADPHAVVHAIERACGEIEALGLRPTRRSVAERLRAAGRAFRAETIGAVLRARLSQRRATDETVDFGSGIPIRDLFIGIAEPKTKKKRQESPRSGLRRSRGEKEHTPAAAAPPHERTDQTPPARAGAQPTPCKRIARQAAQEDDDGQADGDFGADDVLPARSEVWPRMACDDEWEMIPA